MKYFSMFSGIAGFEKGIIDGFKNIAEKQRIQQGRTSLGSATDQQHFLSTEQPTCVGFSEINKYAIQIYQKHFPNHKNYGSATDIIPEQLPDFDLLVGGFPCQAFSIAGKRQGFDDTRGTLFFDIARICKVKQPSYILLENVKGLLSHDKRRTFATIFDTLVELGYDVQTMVLNSKHFGVPQNRERVFFAGCLGGWGGREVFSFGQDDELLDVESDTNEGQPQTQYSTALRSTGTMKADSTFIEEKKIGTIDRGRFRETTEALNIPASYYKGHDNHGARPMVKELKQVGNRVYDAEGISPAFQSQLPGGAHKIKVERSPLKFLTRNQKNIEGDYSFTVDTANTGGVKIGTRIRRLTPVECERLQAYPDFWTETGIDENGNEVKISDSQRYKVIGNSVTTSVISAIIERMYE